MIYLQIMPGISPPDGTTIQAPSVRKKQVVPSTFFHIKKKVPSRCPHINIKIHKERSITGFCPEYDH